MRILGIDPGSRVTGFGIIDQDKGRHHYVASGCIKVALETWPVRMKHIFESLQEIILQYQPEAAAIERVFIAKNPASALKLGQARGAAIAACACLGLTVGEYSAREIKKNVLGFGGADKAQIQYIMKTLLKLSEVPPTDAADALAIALCHGQSCGGLNYDRKLTRRARAQTPPPSYDRRQWSGL